VALAVPICREDEVIASLSIYIPEMRYREEMKVIALDRLKQTAQQINQNLADFSNKL